MERDTELEDRLIDLGAVSTETKGAAKDGPDTLGLRQNPLGISDD